MADDPLKYPSNELDGFASGAITDLRLRIAIDLLKAPGIFPVAEATEGAAAISVVGFVLDVAGLLIHEAEQRGWIQQFSDEGDLSRHLRLQAKRTARFQVAQQMEAQRAAREQASNLAVPMATPMGRN